MKLSDGVEWAIHCVMLLGALPAGGTLSGKALAGFHGVPESYLLKHLKALTAADVLDSVTGPLGGYRLARGLERITLLDIVEAIEGDKPVFRCAEIRRRGPCALGDDAYPRACGVSRAMLRAEAAYRKALAQENLKALTDEFMTSADKRFLAMGQDWFAKNTRMPKS